MTSAPVDTEPVKASRWPALLDCRPIDDSEIEHLAHGLHGTSTFAPGAPRLLSSLLDATLDLETLARRVSAEPGLAVRVLRVANSPYYGQAGRVSSVARAAQVLGLRALRGIAAAACFGGVGIPPRQQRHVDMDALRRHCLATACAAQGLAEIATPGLADAAFMGGLLHDMGVLVQWWLRPDQRIWMAESLASAEQSGHEVELLGAAHAHCGQRLLTAWHLPAAMVAAIGAQGTAALRAEAASAADGTPSLALVLALADRLAADAGLELEGDEPALPWPTSGPLAQACASVADALPAALERLGAVFGD
jgi:HD-like signal output (HDOD) protein